MYARRDNPIKSYASKEVNWIALNHHLDEESDLLEMIYDFAIAFEDDCCQPTIPSVKELIFFSLKFLFKSAVLENSSCNENVGCYFKMPES